MVKRKAEVSLEEWLERAATPSKARHSTIAAIKPEELPNPVPTVDESPSGVKEGPIPETPVDVASAGDDAS